MLGNFIYENPTKVFFGRGAVENLAEALKPYGSQVVLVYGGGSIKKNGIYDAVCRQLEAAGKDVTEIPGVMPNPTIENSGKGLPLPGSTRPISSWR